MKKYISLIATALLAAATLTSCMSDGFDEPAPGSYSLTSTTPIGEVNYSILQLKTDKLSLMNQNNGYELISDDLILEGVVCANDVSGNLYQTILLRHIDADGSDQCIVLGVKGSCLYPFFQLGQRLKVNLKGLYVGVYSKVPKIGQPYKTSSGNWRLGPILTNMCKTNVELVGDPDPNAPELVPVQPTDEWLRATANRTPLNSPMLATVRGTIDEVDDSHKDVAERGDITGDYEPLPKIFGPRALRDAGYGIDRTISLVSNTTNVALRTSTQNEISYARIPQGVHTYTGMLTYYSTWQIQLRDLNDLDREN